MVTYTVGGTATADADYTALSGTVTITAGATTALIDVSVLDDAIEESAESVIVTLTGATGDADVVLGAVTEATVTISDDDAATTDNEVSLAATTPGASEPGTDGQFTVSLSEVATTDTVVTYTVGGTATADADYTALSGTVTITAGATTALIDVSVLDDVLEEGAESVIVTLTGATGDADVVLGASTEATVTISDDDQSASAITVEAESITNLGGAYAIENNNVASGGAMLSLVGFPGNEEGSATFDFAGSSGTYNIVLGAFDESDGAPAASLEVVVNGNSVGTVVLDQDPAGAGANANTQVERSVAQVSINAGDTITINGFESGNEHARFDFIRFEPIGGVSPQVSIVATADGAEPTVPGEFTVNLSQSVGTDTVVSYSVAGTATSGTDYTALTGTVTITAGATSATIAVPVLDDTDVEGTETVIVTLDSVAGDPSVELGGVTTATVDITDDDSVTTDNEVSLAATTPGASEPGTDGQFTVSLSEVATTDTVVTYTVGGTATADADYTALSGTVTITAGATTALIDVSVLDDAIEESAESVIVTLTGATGDADVVLGAVTEATVTISDDDAATTDNEVSLAATTPGASEPGTDGQFTVSLSEVATTDTVVTYTVGGTATADADYTALSGTVTITAGATTALIDVSVLDDVLEEGAESVIVTLTGATGDADVVLGASTEATVTISDDDQSASAITVEAESITNLGGAYAIENNNVASGGAMLSLVGFPGNEEGSATFDFAGSSGTYNIVLGAFDESDGAPAASLEVVVNGNSVGTVVLDQDPAGAGANANTQVERSVAQVSINAGDTITINGFESGNEHARFDFIRFEPIGGVSPQVSIVATADGAEPTVPGEFTVNLSQSVGTDTVVSYSVAGTATSGTDYTALTGTVTITAGATSATIAVPVLDDTDVEGTETVIVTLDSVAGDPSVELGGVTTATVDITDDDSVTTDNEVSLAATTPGASEPGTDGQFTVSLSEVATTDTVVTYTVGGTATADADYTALSGTVTITAGATTALIDVSVLDDAIEESAESVIVTLTGATGDADVVLGAVTEATVTISDDDAATTDNEVSLAATTPGASEPGTDGQFTVSLSEVATTDTVVTYTVGGTATADADYTALSGTVTITAGATTALIDVSVLDDVLEEGAESVIVTLTGATGDADVVLGASTEATVTISDDDQSASAITVEAESITNLGGAYAIENNNVASGGAMLSLVGFPGNEEGSATFDFAGSSGTYNIVLGAFDESDGAPAASLEVVVNGNSVGTVVLDQDPAGAGANANTQVERSVAQVSINAGDTITINGFESGNEHARFDFIRFEPIGGVSPQVSIVATADGAEPTVPGEFTVNLSQSVGTDTVVSYSVAGTATSGTDYTALTGTVTITAGATSATIAVPVLDDTDVEGTETVIVTLDSVAGDPSVELGGVTTATVDITDDDSVTTDNEVSLAATTPGASEPGTDGQFTVSLSEVATTDTVVTYTVGGTATADADYTALSGTVTITAGATTALIDVSVLDDAIEESAESVIVTLTGATGDADVVLGAVTEATVTISDDDAATTDNEVSLAATTPGASEPGTDGQFTVSLSEVATTDTVVTYTVGGTATADADYTALSGTVTITAGATTALIDVSVLDDALGGRRRERNCDTDWGDG